MKDLAIEKNYGPGDFTDKFCQTYREERIRIVHQPFQITESSANAVHKNTLTPIPKPDKDITRKWEHSNIPL